METSIRQAEALGIMFDSSEGQEKIIEFIDHFADRIRVITMENPNDTAEELAEKFKSL